jgi:hypothetical protein
MKMIVVALAALSFAAPALAQDRPKQDWPRHDWRLLKITPWPAQAPASTARDGGAFPPASWTNGSRTGEQVVLWRQYDRDFAHVRTSSQGLRRTDATARAVASSACQARPGHEVSGKSLPEIVRGG